MNPISAVKMATYNAAKTYGLNDIGVLEEGKDADIVILDSLESVEVHSVYKQGRIVNTEFFRKEAKPVNESMLHTVVLKNISKDKIQVKAEGKIPVIGMIPGQIVTKSPRNRQCSCGTNQGIWDNQRCDRNICST